MVHGAVEALREALDYGVEVRRASRAMLSKKLIRGSGGMEVDSVGGGRGLVINGRGWWDEPSFGSSRVGVKKANSCWWYSLNNLPCAQEFGSQCFTFRVNWVRREDVRIVDCWVRDGF